VSAEPTEVAQPIEAITFDFWNTIACERPGAAVTELRRRAIAAACDECGVELQAELLTTSLEQVGASYRRSWLVGTHFHPKEGAEMLVRALGVEGAAGEMVAEAFLNAGRDAQLELAPEIRPCLEALGERGIRLGIVCDVGFTGGELLRGFLDREALLGHFSGWAFSDEVGHYKPAPQIFEAALDALGAEPSEAAHIGDLRRTDIAGAAAVGMRTIRYRGLHDDRDEDGGGEADFVLDSHRELPSLLAHLDRA
jgi:FMN phosphatase YigB (HAD superfamily)